MPQSYPENVRVLRLFAADSAALDEVIQTAQKQPNLTAQSMRQGGETLVLLESRANRGPAARMMLDSWESAVRAACPDSVYAVGDTPLPAAVVEALHGKKQLFSCADRDAAALLEPRLTPLADAAAVYDFGQQSYAHPKFADKIAQGSAFAKKWPDEPVQQAAGRIKIAYRLSGADCVAAVAPAQQPGLCFLLVGDGAGFFVRPCADAEKPALWLLDMLRRCALGLPQAPGAAYVKYGAPLSGQPGPGGFAEPPKAGTGPKPAEKSRHPLRSALIALLVVVGVAAIAAGALWVYTGGDIAGLWGQSGLPQFNVSNASFL